MDSAIGLWIDALSLSQYRVAIGMVPAIVPRSLRSLVSQAVGTHYLHRTQHCVDSRRNSLLRASRPSTIQSCDIQCGNAPRNQDCFRGIDYFLLVASVSQTPISSTRHSCLEIQPDVLFLGKKALLLINPHVTSDCWNHLTEATYAGRCL